VYGSMIVTRTSSANGVPWNRVHPTEMTIGLPYSLQREDVGAASSPVIGVADVATPKQ